MFFVIEGIDGAGCGAQRRNIEKMLMEKGQKVSTLKFPYYNDPIGKMLKDFLKNGKDLSTEMQFLLFAGQMLSEKEKIANLRRKEILIVDHYFASTLCYQGVKGFDYQKGMFFAKIFDLQIPDTIFYLDTPLEIARERKRKEEGKELLDRHEKDIDLISKVDNYYRMLIKNKIFSKWICIDNSKSIDEVSRNIIKIIDNFNKRSA